MSDKLKLALMSPDQLRDRIERLTELLKLLDREAERLERLERRYPSLRPTRD